METLCWLEEYIYLGLYNDELKGCTDRLQTWNKLRKRYIEPRPTDEVVLNKVEYGKEKRCKVHFVNSWDCRPTSWRIVDPNKARNLKNRLALLEQCKINAVDEALQSATNPTEEKKASQTKSMLARYGTSCFLQMLDEDVPSVIDDRVEVMKLERQQRIEQATEKKKKILNDISTLQQYVKLDHPYNRPSDETKCSIVKHDTALPVQQHLVNELYLSHVCLSSESCRELAASTQTQSQSELWHNERKLGITASIMKEVCH